MYLKMVVGSSLDDLPIYAKFYKYAKSYLKSARNLCKIMEIEKDYEWSDGAVVLLLAAHAIELFLKAAIFKKEYESGNKHPTHGHDLSVLIEIFKSLHPNEDIFTDAPFVNGLSKFKELPEIRPPLPGIMYRYPEDIKGKQWGLLDGFEPVSFHLALKKLDLHFVKFAEENCLKS